MKNYQELLNIDDLWIKKQTFTVERWWVWFYCKDCEEIVETTREDNPNKYVFTCKKCNGQHIVIWTLEGLKENYRIK